MDANLVTDISPEKREELFRRAQRNELLKWLIGSALIAFLSWVSTTYLQNREANLQEARFTHEKELQALQFKHSSNLERKKAEQTYLSEYLSYALEDDIQKRLRFAHYFKSLAADTEMAPKWENYYEELLAASLQADSDGKEPSAPSLADRVGGLEPLSAGRRVERIILGAESNISISELKKLHLSQGFSDVGVHFLVRPDGTVEEGRSLGNTPAFVKGQNVGSIAIFVACHNWPPMQVKADEPCKLPQPQLDSLVGLLVDLGRTYNLTAKDIFNRDPLRPGKDRGDALASSFASIVDLVGSAM